MTKQFSPMAEVSFVMAVWLAMAVPVGMLLYSILDRGAEGVNSVVPIGVGALSSFLIASYLSAVLSPSWLSEAVNRSMPLRHQVEFYRNWNLLMGLVFLASAYFGARYGAALFALAPLLTLWSVVRGVRDLRSR